MVTRETTCSDNEREREAECGDNASERQSGERERER
jgi:hypothetical protein